MSEDNFSGSRKLKGESIEDETTTRVVRQLLIAPSMKHPRFDGKNVSKFLRKYEEFTNNYEFTDEQRARRVTNYVSRDRYIDAIQKLDGYKKKDWNALKKEIKEEFKKGDKRYDISRLAKITMKKKKGLDEYLRRFDSFLTKMDEADLTDEIKK